jgi:hypothetical protein
MTAIVCAGLDLRNKGVSTISMIVLALIGIRGAALVFSLTAFPQVSTDYAAALRRIEHHTVVSNFTPAFVSAYTNDYSAAVKLDSLRTLADRRRLELSDFTLFVERDATKTRYLQPEFLLYLYRYGPHDIPDTLRDKGIPVADEGESFVLFDLRRLWNRQ